MGLQCMHFKKSESLDVKEYSTLQRLYIRSILVFFSQVKGAAGRTKSQG